MMPSRGCPRNYCHDTAAYCGRKTWLSQDILSSYDRTSVSYVPCVNFKICVSAWWRLLYEFISHGLYTLALDQIVSFLHLSWKAKLVEVPKHLPVIYSSVVMQKEVGCWSDQTLCWFPVRYLCFRQGGRRPLRCSHALRWSGPPVLRLCWLSPSRGPGPQGSSADWSPQGSAGGPEEWGRTGGSQETSLYWYCKCYS